MEYNKLCKDIGIDKFINSLEHLFDLEFAINLIGLGTAEKNGNRAYFVVVKSEELQEVRKKYGLPEQDFHITLAMKWKDVFGVRKNQVLPDIDPFLKTLSNEFYQGNESFDFIKDLQNFDGDQDDRVDPVKIEDTYATFRVGDNRYYTVSLIGGNLMVSAKWEDNQDIPIMSNTLIYRKLKNKR